MPHISQVVKTVGKCCGCYCYRCDFQIKPINYAQNQVISVAFLGFNVKWRHQSDRCQQNNWLHVIKSLKKASHCLLLLFCVFLFVSLIWHNLLLFLYFYLSLFINEWMRNEKLLDWKLINEPLLMVNNWFDHHCDKIR